MKTTNKKAAQAAIGLIVAVILFCFGFSAPAWGASEGRTAYTVKAGDTAASVAAAHSLDGELVAAMNNIGANIRLSPGSTLWLPEDPSQTIAVERGDTLWELAQRYDTSVNTLVEMNDIANPNHLRVGQRLEVPVIHAEAGDTPEPVIRVAATSSAASLASRGGSGSGAFIWPLQGVITSRFGNRASGSHHGLDIAAPTGTIARAAKAGLITFAGWYSSIYGNCVVIDHGNNQETWYAHASEVLVQKGERVASGEPVIQVGSTGYTTGPHLHFEIRINSKAVNPENYLP